MKELFWELCFEVTVDSQEVVRRPFILPTVTPRGATGQQLTSTSTRTRAPGRALTSPAGVPTGPRRVPSYTIPSHVQTRGPCVLQAQGAAGRLRSSFCFCFSVSSRLCFQRHLCLCLPGSAPSLRLSISWPQRHVHPFEFHCLIRELLASGELCLCFGSRGTFILSQEKRQI